MDFKSFKILFQNEEGMGTAGWDETHFLDLTDLLNEHFTVNDVIKCMRRPTLPWTPDIKTLHITDGASSPSKGTAPTEVVDSWDEETDEPPAPAPAPPLSAKLLTPCFTYLTRLSLAHPGQRASWPELLRLATHLNKLTHLSLAYWPRPSLTPNATTTSMVSKHTSVSLGGSHFYSDLDDDWHEATNILRRFSIATYSLQWLDLEGCSWLKALTWRSATTQSLNAGEGEGAESSWSVSTALPGPDWNDAWRRITYLNVFQGWIPGDSQSLQNMPAGIVPVQLLRWLREHRDEEDVKGRLNMHDSGHVVAEWVHREKMARSVGAEIQAARKKGEGVWCKVDFGWGGAAGEKAS